jgi:hypothetical protein
LDEARPVYDIEIVLNAKNTYKTAEALFNENLEICENRCIIKRLDIFEIVRLKP